MHPQALGLVQELPGGIPLALGQVHHLQARAGLEEGAVVLLQVPDGASFRCSPVTESRRLQAGGR